MDMFDVIQKEHDGEPKITLYGKVIGKFKDDKVQQVLKVAGEDAWSKKLKAYIEDIHIDYDVCPHCVSDEFIRYREIADGIVVGFCANCKADLVSIDGRVEDLRSGKTGVLQSHNQLYNTIKPVRRIAIT